MSNEAKNQSIGALWKKKSQAGQTFLSGSVELPDGTKLEITVFKNTFKKEDKHPDYKVYASRPRPGAPSAAYKQQAPAQQDDAF